MSDSEEEASAGLQACLRVQRSLLCGTVGEWLTSLSAALCSTMFLSKGTSDHFCCGIHFHAARFPVPASKSTLWIWNTTNGLLSISRLIMYITAAICLQGHSPSGQLHCILKSCPFFRKYLQPTFRRNVKNCRIKLMFKHFGYYFRTCYNSIDKAFNVFRKEWRYNKCHRIRSDTPSVNLRLYDVSGYFYLANSS